MLTFSTTSPSQPLHPTHTPSTLVSSIGRPGTVPVFPRFPPLPSNSLPTIDRAPFTALRLQAPPAPPERQTRSGYQRCPPPPSAVWRGRLPPPPPPSPIARTAFPGRRPPGHGPGLEQTTPPTSGLNQQLQKAIVVNQRDHKARARAAQQRTRKNVSKARHSSKPHQALATAASRLATRAPSKSARNRRGERSRPSDARQARITNWSLTDLPGEGGGKRDRGGSNVADKRNNRFPPSFADQNVQDRDRCHTSISKGVY